LYSKSTALNKSNDDDTNSGRIGITKEFKKQTKDNVHSAMESDAATELTGPNSDAGQYGLFQRIFHLAYSGDTTINNPMPASPSVKQCYECHTIAT
jgi:hypothetical protein